MDGRRSDGVSLEETQARARELASRLVDGSVVALKGDLGAGKTTFAKALISELTGVSQNDVSSPTFTYVQSYDHLHHFDLYRLSSQQEFLHKGFGDLIGDGICVIEWPEVIEALLPESTVWVELTHRGVGLRGIHVH